MKERIKAILDSKATWLTLGGIVGTVFGEKAASVINALGSLVMVVL